MREFGDKRKHKATETGGKDGRRNDRVNYEKYPRGGEQMEVSRGGQESKLRKTHNPGRGSTKSLKLKVSSRR